MAGPQTHETPLAGGVSKEENQKTDGLIISGTPDADKIVAGIKARFALLGHEVYELADGGFIVSRWGLTKHCPDVCALGAFLKQIGGAA